jgi:hypothetical protein
MVAPLVGLAVGAAARAVAKKVASNAVKKAATKKAVKEAAKKKPLATPKSAVKVKPAAKQRPNKPDAAKANYKASDGGYRAYGKAVKEYDSMPGVGKFGSAAERQAMGIEAMSKAPVGRRTSIQGKKLNEAEANKATTPVVSNRAVRSIRRGTKTIKINSAPKKTVVKKKSK